MLAGLQMMVVAAVGASLVSHFFNGTTLQSILFGVLPALGLTGALYANFPRQMMWLFTLGWIFAGYSLTLTVAGPDAPAVTVAVFAGVIGYYVNKNFSSESVPATSAAAGGASDGGHDRRDLRQAEADAEESDTWRDPRIIRDPDIFKPDGQAADDRRQVKAMEGRIAAGEFLRKAESEGKFYHYEGHLFDLARAGIMNMDIFRRVMAIVDSEFDLTGIREDRFGKELPNREHTEQVMDLLRVGLISAAEFEVMRDHITLMTVFDDD